MTESRAKKAILLASGKSLSTIVSLIIVAILSRILSKTDYATYRQTLLVYNFAAPLLMLSLPRALYYFLPREGKRFRSVLLENLILLLISGSIFTLFIFSGGNHLVANWFRNPALIKPLLIIAVYPLFMFQINALTPCLVVFRRINQILKYNITSRLFILIFVTSACLVWRNIEAALLSTVIGTAIVFFPAIKLMLNACPAKISTIQLSSMMSQLKYAVPIGLAASIATTMRSIDKIIISTFYSTEIFAVYVNGAMQIPLIGIIADSVTSVIIVDIVKWYKEKEYEKGLNLWNSAGPKCALILMPVMCFLFIKAPEVMTFLYSETYTDSSLPFRIYLLILPVKVVSWDTMLMAANKSKIILFRSVAALISNVILSVILVSKVGYLGAAIATVIVYYFCIIPINVINIKRAFKVSLRRLLPYKKLLNIFFLSAIPGIVIVPIKLLNITNLSANLGLSFTVYAMITGILFSSFGFIDIHAIMKFLYAWIIIPFKKLKGD